MKYKILKNTLLYVVLIHHLSVVVAQTISTDEQLKKNYWTYKQRYLKSFTVYSPSNLPINGSGIPINNVNIFKGGAISPGGSDYEDGGPGGRKGVMKIGDAPEQIGMYLSILALEYRMLKNEGKSTKSTLNEIYYLIQALNRLDDKCENFLAGTSGNANRNGFLMRDDADQQLLQFFNVEYTNSQDKNDNIRAIQSDRHDVAGDTDRTDRELNTMSKDHVMDILKGFMFVKKFVDNELVQPTGSDSPIYIHNEIINITNRIMNYVTQSHSISHQDFPNIEIDDKGYCTDSDIKVDMNYVIWDPVNNNVVPRGNNFNIWAYPLTLMAKSITGTSWDATPLKIKVDGTLCSSWNYQLINTSLSLASSNALIPNAWISAGNNIDENLNSAQSLIDNVNAIDISVGIPTLSILPNTSVGTIVGGNSIHIKPDGFSLNDFIQLNLSFATMSNTWPQNKIVAAADNRFFYNYDLMFALINNVNTLHDKTFYENILLTAPCKGNYNYNYPEIDPTTGLPSWDPIWWHNNRWVHPTDANLTYNAPSLDRNEQGELNGLDYMFLYTMYRYYFSSSIPQQFSEDNSCPCGLQPKIESITDPLQHTLLTSNATISRKFQNYKNIGIYLKEYLNTNLEIKVKTLTNKTDLVICNNSIVTISNNGVLINPNTPSINDSIKITINAGSSILVDNLGTLDVGENTKVVFRKGSYLKASNTNAKIIIRNGGKLIIEPGAFLELNNGGKLIVEDGGQVIIHTKIASGGNSSENGVLTYNQGAEIQLKGDNAILELNGRLHIGDNATFSITYPGSNSGYIKFNRGAGVWWNNWAPNNAHITCGINSKITLIGQNKTDKMIDISQDNVAIPKNLTQFVMSKCLIEFNVGNARLETDRPTTITNSTFKGNYTPISNQTDYTRGLLVFGQQICSINGCDFKDLGTAVTGALFYGGNKLVGVRNCNFYSCNKGIVTVGAGYNISNNSFTNNSESIVTLDNVYNSLIKNNNISSTFPISTISNPNAPFNDVVRTGINVFGGTSAENEISENQINNIDNAIFVGNTEAKIKCNNIQNNMLALYGATNSKINMSSLLNSGYNTASNSSQFAFFDEANNFEANKGYNAFNISNQSPCYQQFVSPPHNYQEICPIITNGSLVNFTLYNPIDGYYENVAEENYWRPITTPQNASIESAYNTIAKINPSNQVLYNARMVTGLALSDAAQVICPNNNGNGNGNSSWHARIHPLDNNSGSSSITTASFYNKQLQYALQFSLTKMDDMQNANKVNEAADLFTEILKANYTLPVKNPVDKYLLDLCYQKLFNCVTLLTNWHKESSSLPLPSSLQNRYNDLFTIIDLRINRKDVLESDFKEINDLVYLDKAMIYRLLEDRNSALNTLSNIIANQPKAEHRNLYENLYCVWKTEHDAINGVITTDEALVQIENCNKNYTLVDKSSSANNRILKNEETSVLTNNIDAFLNPNPTNGLLTITSKTELQKIEVMSVDGKILLSEIPTNISHTLHLDDFANGIYFVNLYQNNRVVMREKVVLNK